jgi:hypothetical protein
VFRLTAKGKEKEFPDNHVIEEILDAYLQTSVSSYPTGPLFPATGGRSRELGIRAMTRIDAARMVRRRLARAKVVGKYSPHSVSRDRINSLSRGRWNARTGTKYRRPHGQPSNEAYDRALQVVLREDGKRLRY